MKKEELLETKLGVEEINLLFDELHKVENALFEAFRKVNDISNDFFGKYVNKQDMEMELKKKNFAINMLLVEIADETTNLYDKIRVASMELMDMSQIMMDRELEEMQKSNDKEFDNKEYEQKITMKDLKEKIGL